MLYKKEGLHMRYTLHLYSTKSASVVIPVFTCETGKPREEENVRRMNGFYEELRQSVIRYTECDTFPEGGKYFAKAKVCDNGGLLKVCVNLKLRQNGSVISQRTLTHTWSDGVVVAKSTVN